MLKSIIDKWPIATMIVAGFSIIYAVTGAVLTIKGDLSFDDYSTKLLGFATASGVLGIARAYLAGKKTEAEATTTVKVTSPESVATTVHTEQEGTKAP